jgi:hypothetical protein
MHIRSRRLCILCDCIQLFTLQRLKIHSHKMSNELSTPSRAFSQPLQVMLDALALFRDVHAWWRATGDTKVNSNYLYYIKTLVSNGRPAAIFSKKKTFTFF